MKTLITLFTLISSFTAQLHSQYKVEWVKTFSTEGKVSIDKAKFVALDYDGNVIVTGTTNAEGLNENLTTIKYDKQGNQLWTAFYNGPGNYHDYPNGMAIDQFNNVYITGGSKGDGGTATDYFTVKYNSSGSEMWAERFTSNGGLHDESVSVAVDIHGNVYVTGFAGHIATDNSGEDWLTIKYNTNGQKVWSAVYDDGIVTDKAASLTIDASGNVYVTGQCRGPGFHIATIKYDTSGKQLWIAKYDGSGNAWDKPTDIKIGNTGEVYITGFSYESNFDYITIKYDNNGNEIWKKNYNGLMNMNDEASSLLTDANGNVYVLGTSEAKKNKINRCIIKYDNGGNEQWNRISENYLSKNIEKLTMKFGNDGNILVTGTSLIAQDKAPTEMVVDCYDKNGTLLWQAVYASKEKLPVASALDTDLEGNIYITGYIQEVNGFFNFCTVKFSK
jgi:hypothetical protein